MASPRRLWVIEIRDEDGIEIVEWCPASNGYLTRQEARDNRGLWIDQYFETRVRCYVPASAGSEEKK